MANRLTVGPASELHAEAIAADLSDETLDTVSAATSLSPLEAALRAMRAPGAQTWAIFLGGELAGLFGVVPTNVLAGLASVWLLPGRAIATHPYAFLRACRPVIHALLEDWVALMNVVDARSKKALLWARWLGFHVQPPIPFGRSRLPFYPIVLRRNALWR